VRNLVRCELSALVKPQNVRPAQRDCAEDDIPVARTTAAATANDSGASTVQLPERYVGPGDMKFA
jgi:hypothetical protein